MINRMSFFYLHNGKRKNICQKKNEYRRSKEKNQSKSLRTPMLRKVEYKCPKRPFGGIHDE